MDIWAIADLHLSFGVPEKTMEVFGPEWANYAGKIEAHWRDAVQPEDLVLIAGDISWAMSLEHAKVDLEWIDHLPGVKALIKGNHDYWWHSLSKAKTILPPSLHLIQNDVFNYQGISVGGTRLWDSDEYDFEDFITYRERFSKTKEVEKPEASKIFKRELERLELSLKQLNKEARLRIAMTHYPPIGAHLASSQVSQLLENYGVEICVFGHLHNVTQGKLCFGKSRGVSYYLTSADYLDFKPLKIYSSAK